jgi:NAD-dependent DNA ligase
MNSLSFNYTDSRGHTTDWTVEHWKESGRYIQGVCTADSQFRTFRKDRVNRYLGEGEAVLTQPYVPAPPKVESRPEICFTGFPKVQRSVLEHLASDHQMAVKKDVTKGLAFLCCGPNAGPAKVAKARDRGCLIIDEPGLKMMLDTGELPEPWEE